MTKEESNAVLDVPVLAIKQLGQPLNTRELSKLYKSRCALLHKSYQVLKQGTNKSVFT